MNPDRLISKLTLERVEAMANDFRCPPALREFHQAQLEDLRNRAALQLRKPARSPFDSFLTKLTHEI